jgi:hypothetical protein
LWAVANDSGQIIKINEALALDIGGVAGARRDDA